MVESIIAPNGQASQLNMTDQLYIGLVAIHYSFQGLERLARDAAGDGELSPRTYHEMCNIRSMLSLLVNSLSGRVTIDVVTQAHRLATAGDRSRISIETLEGVNRRLAKLLADLSAGELEEVAGRLEAERDY